MRVVSFVALVALTISPLRVVGRTQAPAAAPAQGGSFEVASVKPNNSGDGRMMFQNQPGRFTVTNATLRMLIRQAYQVQDSQITGGPGWLADDHFDIIAKLEAPPDGAAPPAPGTPTPLQLALRALLKERFGVVVHNETKEMPVYGLILARSDGKLGPQLKKSETDCAALAAAGRGRGRGPGGPGGPGDGVRIGGPGGAAPGQPIACGIQIGPGSLNMGGASMGQFVTALAQFAGRIVLDKTGLTGGWDLTMTWTPDNMPQRPPGAPDSPIDPNGPSIFTAIQEQLGLKLDSQRGPVEVLVIDKAGHPTPD